MKKVLSFVLVLSLVLSSFSMAFAGETKTVGLTDIAGVANEEAITVVNDLGIVAGYPDGTFQADKAVTRAEFAVMITKALAVPESALAGYTATNFTDVAGYDWAVPYLGFCESKGIMSGYGNGEVKPGNTITVNEAMAMALRAVGYTPNSAVLVGTWPSNYVTLAQDLDLYDEVKAVATVDRGSAAQVIYNALTVQKVQVDADGNTTGLWYTDAAGNPTTVVSMLTSGLGCEVESIDVIEGVEPSIINLTPYKGAYAVAYTNADDEIVAVGEIESTFLTGTYSSAAGIFTTTDEVEYKLASDTAITSAGFSFLNGVGSASDGTATYAANAEMPDTAEYTISVALKGKKVVELYAVSSWDVANATAKMIEEADLVELEEDLTLITEEFKLTDEDEIDLDSFELLGVNSLSEIKADDVVYVYTDGSSDNYITRVEVSSKTVEGTVSKVASGKYTIAGEKYEVSANTNVSVADLGIGSEGTAYLDFNGNIFAWDESNAAAGNYALFVAYDSTEAFGTSSYAIKLVTAEGKTATFAADTSKVTETALSALSGDVVVEYSLNKDGEVNKITTGALTKVNDYNTGVVAKDGSLVGTYKAASNVVVFVKDGTDYSVGKLSDIKTDLTQTSTVDLYHDTNKVVKVIFADAANDLGNTNNNYGIVVAQGAAGLDADGEPATLISLFVDGKEMTDLIDASGQNQAAGVTLFDITFNADGSVKTLSAHGLSSTVTGVTATAISGDIVTVTTGALENNYKIASDAVIYIYDSVEDEYTIVTSLSKVRGLAVALYDTDSANGGVDADGVFDVIIATK